MARRLGAGARYTFGKPSHRLALVVLGGALATVVALRLDKPQAEADYQRDLAKIVALKPQLDAALDDPALDQKTLLPATVKFVHQVSQDKYPVTDKAGQDFYYPDWTEKTMEVRSTVDAHSLRQAADKVIDDFESPGGRSNFLFSHEADRSIVLVKRGLNKIQSHHHFQETSLFSRWPAPQLIELNQALQVRRPDGLHRLASN